MKISVPIRFGILSFLCVVALALAMGFALSHLLTQAVLDWEWENTAAYARQVVELGGLHLFFTTPVDPEARQRWGEEFSRLFTTLPEVVRVKVWDREGTVLWSDEAQLIGQRFPNYRELQIALTGKVAAEIEQLTGAVHFYERGKFRVLAEVHVPIFSKVSGEVVGVVEVYKTPVRLFATIRWGQAIIWTISSAGSVVLYLVLLPVFRHWRKVREEALHTYAEGLEQAVKERTQELESKTVQLQEALAAVDASQQRIIQGERIRALGQMAGGVAHDFNNTLAVILARARLLLDETADPEVQRELRVIEKAARDGAQTVRRIQEFTRMRRAGGFRPVDLNRVVEEVVEITRSRWKDEAQAHGISYDVVVETTPLPPVAGDPAELREALTNILLNALDAMPEGGRVRLKTAVEGERVHCVVTDTGIGMTEEVKQRLFEPFFSTKGERGNGLGLSVVYGIVARHGGEVEVQSRVGQGSAFTIQLPVGRKIAGSPSSPPSPQPRRNAKILVIEDKQEAREVMRDLLVRQGHAVAACADGESGLARLEAEPFDLVITDLGMPGVSGWQVASVAKLRNPDLPVALVTGWSDRIDPEEARAKGVDFVVAKPFTPEDLDAVVAQALAQVDCRPYGLSTPSEETAPGTHPPESSESRGRVLIVDDEAEVRQGLIKHLQKKGFEALGAGDGEEGLRRIAEFRPHVVLLDIAMPRLAGVETLRRIKALPQETCVVMVSGTEDLETARQTLALGAADYVGKPVDFAYLDTVLELLLITSVDREST